MSLAIAFALSGIAAAQNVDRTKDFRRDQRPRRYYKAMEVTWKVGRGAILVGVPLTAGAYIYTTSSFDRDPDNDSSQESVGYTLGTAGAGLALAGPPIMLFASMSAIPALSKTGVKASPTMGLVGTGFYLASVGTYYAALDSFSSDPEGDGWKVMMVGGTVALGASGFFAQSQIKNTERGGKRISWRVVPTPNGVVASVGF